MIENLNLGKTRFKTSVFEKHFISYSCILFIKFYTLKSFYINLLCFSKNCFFQNFDRLNLFLNQLKFWLKFWLASVCFDWCSIDAGSFEAFSINWTYFSINRKSYREFFKNLGFSHVQSLFKSFKHFFSLYSIGQGIQPIFLSFSSDLFARFFSPKASKTLLPLLFLLFLVFMHFCHAFRDIFEPRGYFRT